MFACVWIHLCYAEDAAAARCVAEEGAMYSLGAHDGVPRAMVDRCVGRMKAFVTLAREAVSAEFPDFELSYALRVFDLSAVAAPASADEDLDRVASCLRLDVAALRAQFQDMLTLKYVDK